MPIYEYTCQKCEAKFEKLVRSMNGEEKAVCPECGSSRTRRSLSVFAVGAEQAGRSAAPAPAMCQRCGGAGPCAME